MMRRCTGFILGLCLAMGASAQNGVEHTPDDGRLRLGDKAPALHVTEWTKGKPVKTFETDKVYVVEFWATWCPPCLRSIPHLTQLQKEYRDKNVTIIGVTSEDRSQDRAKIVGFVEERGDDMNYTLMLDKGNQTGAAYMAASGQSGIPTAFVIDKKSRIAWIGHPMAGLDKVLEQVVAGTYDLDAEVDKRRSAMEEERRVRIVDTQVQEALAKVNEAWNAGNKKEALDLIEPVLDLDFERRWMLAIQKFEMLVAELDEADAGYDYASSLIDGRFRSHPAGLRHLAWVVVAFPEEVRRDLDMARRAADLANEVTKGNDPAVLDTVARIHFEQGRLDEAIEVQTRAVELADDDLKFELEFALDRYRAARGGAG